MIFTCDDINTLAVSKDAAVLVDVHVDVDVVVIVDFDVGFVVVLLTACDDIVIWEFLFCCCAQNQLVITIVKQLLLPTGLSTAAVDETK